MNELLERLGKYPSSFQLHEEKPEKTDALVIKTKLLLELLVHEYDTDIELNRTQNLISYLCFIIAEPGETKDYRDYNKEVLKRSPENVVALANKAWFLYYEKKYKACDCICKKLAILYNKAASRLVAEAEIAYAYARFGPRCCERAKELYEDVLGKCEELRNGTNIDKDISLDYVCIWMFGYALAQKRSMNIHNTQTVEIMLRHSPDMYRHLTDIYCQIIKLNGDSNCLKKYKARSYVGLVWVVGNAQKDKNFTLHEIFQNYPDLLKEPDEYIAKALNMSRDVYVLIECGKHFRYTRRIDKSIEILKEAVKTKSTSSGHHHLALSLKRKLEKDVGHFKAEGDSINNESDVHNSTSKRHVSSHQSIPRKRKHEEDNSSTAYFNKKMRRSAYCHRGNHTLDQRRKSRTRTQKQHCTTSRHSPITSMIKNPKYLRPIHYDKTKAAVDEIFLHLNKAIKINGNTDAMYDKGLLWRQLGKYENALQMFEILLKNENGRCSPINLTNVFEQAAICIKYMLNQSDSKDKSLIYDMRFYFKSSIEISADFTEQTPSLKHCWKSPKELKSILLNLSNTKETLKERLFLYTKTRDYKAALEVFQQLGRMAENEVEKVDLLKEIVRLYINLGEYNNAVEGLTAIRCFPKGSEMIDENLCRNTHIEAGLQLLKVGCGEIAKQYIKEAFIDTDNKRQNTYSHFGGIPEGSYDVMILCDPDNEDKGRKLLEILSETGLHATLNTDSKSPGTSRMNMTDVMEKSKHFAVLFDLDITDHAGRNRIQFNTTIVQEMIVKRTSKSNIVIIKCSDTEIPHVFLPYQTIDMDLDNSEKDFLHNVDLFNSVKSMLLSLASS